MIKVNNRKVENNQSEFIRLMQKWTFSLKSHYWLLMWEWKGIGLRRGEKLIILNYILNEYLHYLQFLQNSNLFTEKTNDKISRKVQKKANFRPFWDQIWPKNFFFKNRAPSHFMHCHFASLCKNSEKKRQNFEKSPKNPNFVPFWAVLRPNLPKKIMLVS